MGVDQDNLMMVVFDLGRLAGVPEPDEMFGERPFLLIAGAALPHFERLEALAAQG
jgi:hypothetical protein